MSRIAAENLFQSSLKERQLNKHRHRFKRLRGHRFPAAIVGSTSRREKERPLLNPMSDPRLFVFAFLKIDLTRHGPCEEWFADRGQLQRIDYRRERDDPG